MRVTHVSPAIFGASGLFGGGERYPLELAKSMAEQVPTRLVSFADKARTYREGNLNIELLPIRTHVRGVLNPLAEGYPGALRGSDVVHVHQMRSMLSDYALLTSGRRGRKIFGTDHGGGSKYFSRQLGFDSRLSGFLPVSGFSQSHFPQFSDRSDVIYGGVDVDRFTPDDRIRAIDVLYVGRLLPHKGVDVLIRALPAGASLDIIGRSYDAEYLRVLHELAVGKCVRFHEAASDADILAAYRTARVFVLPSVYRTPYGPDAPFAELLGLVLIEAMACGTPVISSNVGGMPEVVADGLTGHVVPPSDVEALGAAIEQVLGGSTWDSASRASVERVHELFTWKRVVERCLLAYEREGAQHV